MRAAALVLVRPEVVPVDWGKSMVVASVFRRGFQFEVECFQVSDGLEECVDFIVSVLHSLAAKLEIFRRRGVVIIEEIGALLLLNHSMDAQRRLLLVFSGVGDVW